MRRYFLLILFRLFDVSILVGALIAASLPGLRRSGTTSFAQFLAMRFSVRNFVLFAGLVLLWHFLFTFFNLYESKRLASNHSEDVGVFKAAGLCTLALGLAGSLLRSDQLEPAFLGAFWMSSTAMSILSRHALRYALGQIRLRGRNLRNILIVGTNLRALKFAFGLEANPMLGYRIIGFVDRPWSGMEEFRKSGFKRVCDLEELPEFLRGNAVDEVIIALPMKSFYNEARDIGVMCEEQGLTTRYLSSLFDTKMARATSEEFEGEPIVTMAPRMPDLWAQAAKRLLDVVLSMAAVMVLSPVFVFTMILIKFTSPGPVLFVQKRLGRGKRIFPMYKFRTMVPNAEQKQAALEHLNEASGPVFKIKNDPRITGVGRFLRRSSIDELPQFFNVMRGDMSLVGPRPLPVRDYRGFDEDWQRRRFCVRPGITCLWQVNGRSAIGFDEWMELDLEYIDRCSLRLDLEILVRTIPAVFRRSGAA